MWQSHLDLFLTAIGNVIIGGRGEGAGSALAPQLKILRYSNRSVTLIQQSVKYTLGYNSYRYNSIALLFSISQMIYNYRFVL